MDIASYAKVGMLTPDQNSGSELTFTDTTVEGGKAYLYRLIAVNVAGLNSEPTLPYDGIPLKVSADPPTLDGGATPFNSDTLTVSFRVLRPASGANAYLIDRSSDGGQTWKDLGARESGGQITNIEDKLARGGATFLYRVRAVDMAGNVSSSVTLTVVTGS